MSSRGTRDEANRLAAYLEQHGIKVPKVGKEIDEASPASVLKATLSILKQAEGPGIGVNYTGGTKVMATHCYRAAEMWAHEKVRPVWFSYLDARRQQMVFTRSGEREDASAVPLSACPVKVSLNELRQLHGIGHGSSDDEAPSRSRPAAMIAELMPSMGTDAWKEWKEELKRDAEPRSSCPELKSIESVLRAEAHLPEGKPLTKQALAQATGRSQRSIELWADGTWLEQYVLAVLKSLADEVESPTARGLPHGCTLLRD